MKRKLVVTYEIDDAPWFSADDEEWNETDPEAEAISILKDIACYDEFVQAELDGCLIFNRTGEAPESIKKFRQYEILLESLHIN